MKQGSFSMIKKISFAVVIATTLAAACWPGAASAAQPAPLQPVAASDKQKGIAYTSYWPGEYQEEDADDALRELAATGANWISILVTNHQDTIYDTTIYQSFKTPTDADVIHVIQYAHSLGLKVFLKPHIDTLYDDHWRGIIGTVFTTETEWSTWFASYRQFINHYAQMAQTYNVEQFCIGTELEGVSHREADWRRVAAEVRTYYKGPITYAADSVEDDWINWWDALDYIGLDVYYQLTDSLTPSLADLKAGWQPYLANLKKMSEKFNKPILFTEIGYNSRDGGLADKTNYDDSAPVDLEEQKLGYQAAFETVFDQPWLLGFYWWKWTTDPFQGGSWDNGSSPHDKPAEDFLRKGYGGAPRPAATQRSRPDFANKLEIYTQSLTQGWKDWSWSTKINFGAQDPINSSDKSLSVRFEEGYGALSLHIDQSIDTTPYTYLVMDVLAASGSEPKIQVTFADQNDKSLRSRPADDPRYLSGGTVESGVWKQVVIPLEDLRANGQQITRFTVKDRTGEAPNSIYLKNVWLTGAITNQDSNNGQYMLVVPLISNSD